MTIKLSHRLFSDSRASQDAFKKFWKHFGMFDDCGARKVKSLTLLAIFLVSNQKSKSKPQNSVWMRGKADENVASA